MPRVKCPRCSKVETILRSGFIRNKQRYYCKECNYNFTLHHVDRKANHKLKKNYQVTIIDIAKAMGISPSTVSRALHDHPDIGTKTKEEVKALAKTMDYRPNLLARSFASNHTGTIGVIIPNLEATFFSSMLGGIQQAASQAGYKVIMCQSNENHETEMGNVNVLMDNQVEGLFICHSIENKSYEQIKLVAKRNTPIVHFYRVCMETPTSKVIAKNKDGAREITTHLIDQGCRRIAILLGPEHLLISQERLEGYLAVLKKQGIPVRDELICHTDFRHSSVTRVVDRWLKLTDRPDAIFCISDRSAIYALKHLKAKHIRVPQDICVAGFGNDLIGELIEPGLTTYDVKTTQIGKAAMQLFMEQITSTSQFRPRIKLINGNLIIRDSTRRKP